MKRSMSSREMMVKAGKEIAKSVVVAKTVQVGARRTGLTAAASVAGTMAWGAGLVVARKLHPQYLDPVSANQINRDPEFVMNCHVLLQTKDTVKKEDIHATFEFYVQHFSRFRERVVVRQFFWPYWEPVEKVDLNQHIFFDYAPTEHAGLEENISNSLTQGLNPLQPLWRCTIYPNFTMDDGTLGNAILFKMHHCIGDGYSLAKTLFTAVTRTAPAPEPSAKPTLVERAHQPGQVGKVFEASKKLLLMKDDPPSTLKAKKLLTPLDTRFASYLTTRMSIPEIKRAAKNIDATINDLIIAALSAALRIYQIRKGNTELIDPLSVLWVALKPLAEAFQERPASEVEEPSNSTLGACYVRLPIKEEYPDRLDRVRAVTEQIQKLKGSPEPLMAQKIVAMFGLLPMWLSNPIWTALSNKVSMSVSNVPGPPMEFKWAGIIPTNMCIWVPPVGTISSFMLINSFRDKLTIALAMDADVFTKEDVAFLNKTFDDELEHLTTIGTPSKL